MRKEERNTGMWCIPLKEPPKEVIEATDLSKEVTK